MTRQNDGQDGADNSRRDLPSARSQPVRAGAPGLPPIHSNELLAGGRERIIRHGEDDYRLRLTGNNKLILTK